MCPPTCHHVDTITQEDTTLEEEAAPNTITYKLKLEGGGVTVDREVSEDQARQIVAVVMGGAALAAPLTRSASGIVTPRASGQTGLREFIDQVSAERNPEKILAIGAYLIDKLGQEHFSREDVKAQFKNAGEGVPGNYPRDFKWAVTAGWIAPNPQAEDHFFVTDTGHQALEQQFPDEVREKTRQSKSARRRRQTKTVEKASE